MSDAPKKPTYNDEYGLPNVHYNPLNNYRNVSYAIRLTMMPVGELGKSRTERSYDYNKGLVVIDTGGAGTIHVEELEIKATGAGNATGNYISVLGHQFKGRLVEPIGGRFIEFLSLAAMSLTYPKTDAALYLLEITFNGYDGEDAPTVCKGWDNEPMVFRWYVKIATLEFNLDMRGGMYDFTMYPDISTSLLSDFTRTEEGMKIIGGPGTIGEICKGFEAAMNKKQEDYVKAGMRCYPHVYKISAHKELANLKVYDGLYGFLNQVWHKSFDQSLSPGTSVEEFLRSAATTSKEVLKFLNNDPERKQTNGTDLKPNKIDKPARNLVIVSGAKVRSENNKPLFDNKMGGFAHEVHYLLTSRQDSRNILGPSEFQDAWDPINRDKRINNWVKNGLIRKVYKWIHTGENTDVINIDLKMNNMWRFVRPLWIDHDGKPASPNTTQDTTQKRTEVEKIQAIKCNEAKELHIVKDPALPLYGEDLVERDFSKQQLHPQKDWYSNMAQVQLINASINSPATAGSISPEMGHDYAIFRQIHNTQSNSGTGDLMTLAVDLVGDPYWLFQIPGSPPWEDDVWEFEKTQTTQEELAEKRKKTATLSWLPFFYFEAIIPSVTLDSSDLMKLRRVDTISGIYSANEVVNKFSKGKFTTTITKANRDPLLGSWFSGIKNRADEDSKSERTNSGTAKTVETDEIKQYKERNKLTPKEKARIEEYEKRRADRAAAQAKRDAAEEAEAFAKRDAKQREGNTYSGSLKR